MRKEEIIKTIVKYWVCSNCFSRANLVFINDSKRKKFVFQLCESCLISHLKETWIPYEEDF